MFALRLVMIAGVFATLATGSAAARVDCANRGNIFDPECATAVYQPADAAFRSKYLEPSDKTKAANKTAASLAEFKRLIAGLRPGDILEVADGVWRDAGPLVVRQDGEPDRPITIRTRRAGGVVFEGYTTLLLAGSYIRYEGFSYRGSFKAEKGRRPFSTISLGSKAAPCTGCLVDSVAFDDYNADDKERYHRYVTSVGHWNRISRSAFDGKHGVGQVVTADKTTDPDQTLIDRNYFANIPPARTNGHEAITVGNAHAWTDSGAVIERNLFYRTRGEVEIISVKSNGVVIRDNSFVESAHTITLRAADGVVVEGNVFEGNGVASSGGVRIFGSNHAIVHNIFRHLNNPSPGGHAISIMAGQQTTKPPPAWYKPVLSTVIAFNSFVENRFNWIVGGRATQTLANQEPRGVVFGYNDLGSEDRAAEIGGAAEARFVGNRCEAGTVDARICADSSTLSQQPGVDRNLYRQLGFSPEMLARLKYVNISPGKVVTPRLLERADVGPASWSR